MDSLDESELREKLHAEGFSHAFVWQDRPNAFYPNHTHNDPHSPHRPRRRNAANDERDSEVFRVGDRCDVPAGAVHSAKIGPHGCRYLIGEK